MTTLLLSGHFQFTRASLLALVAYGQIVGATMLGFIVFGELSDAWTWLGTSILISCGLYIGYRERAANR